MNYALQDSPLAGAECVCGHRAMWHRHKNLGAVVSMNDCRKCDCSDFQRLGLVAHPDRKNVWVRPTDDTPEERIREIARAVARIADNLELPQTADQMRRIANGQ